MELEMKFKVERNYVPILELQGFKKEKRKHQIDTYFINGEIIDGKKTWLRIREDKIKKTFSCDLHRLNSPISTEEIEIVLNTHDDVNKMYKIIETLGYSIKCIVDKERNVYKKGDIEISLDNVNGLGNFIEIEINGEENQENLIRLKKTAKQLGLSIAKQIKNGYPNLLQEKIKETQRS